MQHAAHPGSEQRIRTLVTFGLASFGDTYCPVARPPRDGFSSHPAFHHNVLFVAMFAFFEPVRDL